MFPTWLRSVFGIAAGGLNLFANGMNWKQVLVSLAVTGLGIVSQLSSTSNQPRQVMNVSNVGVGVQRPIK
jgi:hypothetical protein